MKSKEDIKKEIISYCRSLIKRIKIDYLEEFDVYKNEFLEFLFLHCLEQYENEGFYELTDESVAILFSVKKQNELYMKKIKAKEITIIGIDKNDNLIIDEENLNPGTEV
jgi:hypothetical protein